MSRKVFLAGMACGAATILAVAWLIPDAPPAVGDIGASRESISLHGNSVSEIPGEEDASPPAIITAQRDPSVEAVEANLISGPRESPAPDVPDTVERESAPAEPGSSSSAESDETIERDTEWWLEQRRAALDAEARDDSWAYYMEQALTQYLAQHPGIAEFDVSYVECRTSFCQLQVIGFDASTDPTWSRILYDLRQALPEQTASWGITGYDLEGRYAIVTTLQRAR